MLALNPWLILGASLAAAAALCGSYVKGRNDGRAVEIAQRVTIEEVSRTAREASQQAAAEAIAKIEVKNVTIRQRLETEIREKPVYRDCIADERVLGTVNEAITGNLTTGSGELPTAGPNDGTDVR